MTHANLEHPGRAADLHSPIADTARRVRTPVPDSVDVAIIGCGLGGLQAGALLAQVGLRVACFDQHYVAGGCATMFERGRSGSRWRFDVGVHYVGDCGPDGPIPGLLRRAGVHDVAYAALDPDGFDTLVFPGLEFRVPVGLERYRQRLYDTFPKERSGIDRYCRFLAEVDQLAGQAGQKPTLKTALHVLLRGRLAARYRNATVQQLLDDCTRDPLLRAVMLGQSGDYGVRPREASALLHAGLVMHYFHGAWYPKGGGQVFADKLAARIESLGGTIHLRRGVKRILVEQGRAVGIELEGKGAEPGPQVRARAVLSNADIKKTWLELLGPAHLPKAELERAQSWKMAGALWISCFGVEGDLGDKGKRPTNYWQFDSVDVDDFYDRADGRPDFTPGGCYVTSATAKDPDTPGHAPLGCSTVEAMTLVPSALSAWGLTASDLASEDYRKRSSYLEMKQRIEADMLARVDKLLPGVGSRVVFAESSSPMTHYRFTRASDGTGYGLAATPEQFLAGRPGYRGPVAGLYQCGGSTRSGHGVFGAMRSGEMAAQRVAVDLGRPIA